MDQKIVLADINSWNVNGISNGHYLPVAKNMSRVLADTGHQVVVAGGAVYANEFSGAQYLPLPYSVSSEDGFIRRKLKVLFNLISLWRSVEEGSIVIFQASASVSVFLGIALLPLRKCRIFIIQYSDVENLSGMVRKTLWRVAKRKVSGILCPNDEVGLAYGIPFCVVPDYFPVGIGLMKDYSKKYDFCFVGTITPKKGTIEGVRSLVKTNKKILVAGRASESDEKTLKHIASANPNLYLQLGYLKEKEYYDAIRSSKMCVLNYDFAYSNQSSGVVLDILYHHVPVCGRRCRAIEFVEDYDVGVLYDDVNNINVDSVLSEDRLQQLYKNIDGYISAQATRITLFRNFIRKNA